MTSEEIKALKIADIIDGNPAWDCLNVIAGWLKEIAFQLAIQNEGSVSPPPGDTP